MRPDAVRNLRRRSTKTSHWLGIAWETPVRRQSDHLADYRAALDRLAAMGLLYPSFESRAEIAALVKEREADGVWPRDPDAAPLYPGTAKLLPADERERLLRSGGAYALRLDMDAACRLAGDLTWTEHGSGPDGQTGRVTARPEAWGDVVLARKETPTSYHLSVVIDDALQGVTDVVRGQDLFWSTGVHRLLQKILDLPQPAYRHHDLIRDDAGAKLSKSSAATGVAGIAHQGEDARGGPEAYRPVLKLLQRLNSRLSACLGFAESPSHAKNRPA